MSVFNLDTGRLDTNIDSITWISKDNPCNISLDEDGWVTYYSSASGEVPIHISNLKKLSEALAKAHELWGEEEEVTQHAP